MFEYMKYTSLKITGIRPDSQPIEMIEMERFYRCLYLSPSVS